MSQQGDVNNGRGGGEAQRAQAKTPEEIKQEIARTRSALSQDVAALSEKLSPEHWKDGAKEVLHDAKDAAKEGAKEVIRDAKQAAVDSLRYARDHAVDSITETVHEVGQRVQEAGSSTAMFVSTHAVPLSLVGLGVGWLVLSIGHSRRQELLGYRGDEDRELDSQGIGARLRGAAHSARETVGDVAERASHTLGERGEQLRERAGEMRSQLVQRASDARERTVELGKRAYQGVERAGERARDLGEENPLAFGLLALAAGIGIGLLIPATRGENRLLGETRDRLARDARRTASQLRRSVQQGAGEVRDAMRE